MLNINKAFLLTLLLLLGIVSVGFSCTCYIQSIRDSYITNNLIFYGKFIGTDTIENFRTPLGEPVVVDNFEVLDTYKGINVLRLDYVRRRNKIFKLSLINYCNESCGSCFTKSKMYLVYAYLDDMSGQLRTDGCTRTREIVNGNFVADWPYDPNRGADEKKLLEREMSTDGFDLASRVYYLAGRARREAVISQANDLRREIKIKNFLAVALAIVNLILVIVISHLRKRKKPVS